MAETVNGNYPGCIVDALLERGERLGDADELLTDLEFAKAACIHTTDEDFCIMSPVASGLGLVALESKAGEWWPQGEDAFLRQMIIRYPALLMGERIRKQHHGCSAYEEPKVAVGVDSSTEAALPISDGYTLGTLVHTETYADLLDPWRRKASAGRELPGNDAEIVIGALCNFSYASISPSGKIRKAAELQVKIEGHVLTRTDRISGIAVYKREPVANFGRPPVPDDVVALEWPRVREVKAELTEADVRQFSTYS